MSDWSDERVLKLREFWDRGLSTTVIGARLGVSKGAVCGKVNRLGLSRGIARSGKAKSQKVKENAKPMRREECSEPRRHDDYRSPPEDLPRPEVQLLTADLEDHHCRYPYGDPKGEDFTFCGRERIPLLAYCEAHARRCFTSVEAAKRESLERAKEMA